MFNLLLNPYNTITISFQWSANTSIAVVFISWLGFAIWFFIVYIFFFFLYVCLKLLIYMLNIICITYLIFNIICITHWVLCCLSLRNVVLCSGMLYPVEFWFEVWYVVSKTTIALLIKDSLSENSPFTLATWKLISLSSVQMSFFFFFSVHSLQVAILY